MVRSSSSSLLLLIASVCPALLATGCAQAVDRVGADGVAPAALSWYLPKTAGLDITVVTEVRACMPELVVAVHAEATPVVVTDWTRRHSTTIEGLGGPFGTAELSVEAWPEGMVKSLGGKSEDRTGPVIVAVVETALKVAALSFGGAGALASRPSTSASCTPEANRNAALLAAAQKALTEAPLDDKALAGRTAQIERLKAALRTQDNIRLPFDDAPPASPIPDRFFSVNGAKLVDARVLTADPFRNPVRLTVSQAYVTGAAPGPRPVVAEADYHYREPVRMTVTLHVGCADTGNCGVTPSNSAISFGVAQWGIPRRLPLRVGLFGNVSFSMAFQQDGSLTNQRGATTAAPAEGAASLGRTIATNVASSDPRTAGLKARTDRIQAELDFMQARAKLDAAKAAQAAQPTQSQP